MRYCFCSLILLAVLAIYTPLAWSEGHITAIWGYNPVDSLLGVTGKYEGETSVRSNTIGFEVEGLIQRGDITESDSELHLVLPLMGIELQPFASLDVIKTDDWGSVLDGGLKFNVPAGDLDIAVGVFGRNSNAFAPIENGTRINGDDSTVVWEDATLLDFNDLGTLNALLQTEFDFGRADVGLIGIYDISNQKFHELIVDIDASFQLENSWRFNASAELINRTSEEDDGSSTLLRELSVSAGIGYTF